MNLSSGLTLALVAIIVVAIIILVVDRVLGRVGGRRFLDAGTESYTAVPTATVEPSAYLFLGRIDGLRVPLVPGMEYVLGRGREANVRLALGQGIAETDIRTVSRRHAVLRFEEGAWTLRDQGSANGTWINGRRTGVNRLRSGSRINLGLVPLWFFV